MFENPFVFLLIPGLVFLGWWVIKNNPSVPFSSVSLVHQKGMTWKTKVWWLPDAFRLLGLLAMLFGLAGPFESLDSGNRSFQGLRIALVIDRSGSMGYEVPLQGKWISRLEGVKKLTGDFILSRKDDQITLLSFARYPETHSPLTQNPELLKDFLQVIQTPSKPEDDGTSIGDAVTLAIARLEASRGREQAPGIIILLTDGQSNAGKIQPLEGAKMAKEKGIRIYTIGLRGQGTMVQNTGFGLQRVSIGSDLDEQTLQGLSKSTGGDFFAIDDLGELSSLYQRINTLERTRLVQAQPEHRIYNLVFYLVIALVLFTLEWAFILGIFRRMP